MLTLIQTAKLNDVDPQAWLADVLARIADPKSPTSLRCCPGIGAASFLSPAPPDVAAPAHAITIRRAVEILGEDETLLWLGPGTGGRMPLDL